MTNSPYTLQICLPEGITFSMPLGGPVIRCVAFILDVVAVLAAGSLLQRILAAAEGIFQDLGAGVLVIAYFAIWTLYGMLCEFYWNGQTLGKWLLGLRVVDATGLELQFYQVAIRNLVRSVDLLPAFGLVGGLTMLCNRRLQRLGDLAAGTIVIRTRRPSRPNVDALIRGRYNSFLEEQLLCARLRQRVPPAAGALAIDALLRRDELEDRARLVVFDDLSAYFRKLAEFPPEKAEVLTSEQYVRNVVEILYSPASRVGRPKTAFVAQD